MLRAPATFARAICFIKLLMLLARCSYFGEGAASEGDFHSALNMYEYVCALRSYRVCLTSSQGCNHRISRYFLLSQQRLRDFHAIQGAVQVSSAS